TDVGTSFGKYFLMKKLAAGGMGEVFLAKQQGPAGFQKMLVVKKILSHLTESKEFVEAFLGEARLAAQMSHRNIVQDFELGQQTGAYSIAMEYVQAKSLRDLMDSTMRRKEKIPAEVCGSLPDQIRDGPGYALFDPIIANALAKDRDRRYSDACEMQDDLRRVVLPSPPERLGQFMSRLFRAQLEEEQKLMFDSDRARLTGAGPRRTPPRA